MSAQASSARKSLPTGPMAAALVAVPIGAVSLLLAHHSAVQSKVLEAAVYGMGKWIPGAEGSGSGGSIGPYSGKEVIAVVAWLTGWLVLHALWRKREIRLEPVLMGFFAAMGVITLLFLHPLADPIFSRVFG